jgi:hypothetical protein
MLYRSLATTIVLFWVTMTALLLRKELGSGDNSLREVPLGHVGRLFFTHEQANDLQIYRDKQLVGHLGIRPRVLQDDGRREINFAGTIDVTLPGAARQRVAWSGEAELDAHLELQRLKATLSLREPAGYTVEVLLEPAAHRLIYETRAGHVLIKRMQYALDENGARAWLRDEGIDPALVMGVYRTQSMPMTVRALQSSLAVHGEKIETYLVSVVQGEQTMAEAHVSQLGQILRLRTFLGYGAAPEGLTP